MNIEGIVKTEKVKELDSVISQIKELINYKNLEPGDKLPSERKLSEKFNVSRGMIRTAIQKLEFYGLLRSIPQSGTFVANIGVIAMNGMIDDIIQLEDPTFKNLVESRILLELECVKKAAIRRTEENLAQIKSALDAYNERITNGQDAVQEDLLFHLSIAKATQNSTLNTFMLTITPEIITNFERYHICDKSLSREAMAEHEEIYNAILTQDANLAKQKMKEHFKVLYQYCYQETE